MKKELKVSTAKSKGVKKGADNAAHKRDLKRRSLPVSDEVHDDETSEVVDDDNEADDDTDPIFGDVAGKLISGVAGLVIGGVLGAIAEAFKSVLEDVSDELT